MYALAEVVRLGQSDGQAIASVKNSLDKLHKSPISDVYPMKKHKNT